MNSPISPSPDIIAPADKLSLLKKKAEEEEITPLSQKTPKKGLGSS